MLHPNIMEVIVALCLLIFPELYINLQLLYLPLGLVKPHLTIQLSVKYNLNQNTDFCSYSKDN